MSNLTSFRTEIKVGTTVDAKMHMWAVCDAEQLQVSVCERESERERIHDTSVLVYERESTCHVCACVFVCACVRS